MSFGLGISFGRLVHRTFPRKLNMPSYVRNSDDFLMADSITTHSDFDATVKITEVRGKRFTYTYDERGNLIGMVQNCFDVDLPDDGRVQHVGSALVLWEKV